MCRKFVKKKKNLHWNCNFDAKDPKNIFKRMEACKKIRGSWGRRTLHKREKIDSPIIQANFCGS